jgi:hypothetical protein
MCQNSSGKIAIKMTIIPLLFQLNMVVSHLDHFAKSYLDISILSEECHKYSITKTLGKLLCEISNKHNYSHQNKKE